MALSQGFLTPKGNEQNPVWKNKHSPGYPIWAGKGRDTLGGFHKPLDNLYWGTGVRALGTVPGARVSWPRRCPRQGGSTAPLSVPPNAQPAKKVLQQDRPRVPWSCRGQVWAGEPRKQQADSDIPGIRRSGSSSPTAGDGASGSAQPQMPFFWASS